MKGIGCFRLMSWIMVFCLTFVLTPKASANVHKINFNQSRLVVTRQKTKTIAG